MSIPHDNELSLLTSDTAFDATKVLDSMGNACYVLDHEWRFAYLNSSAERLLNRTRRELLGRSTWEVFPDSVGGVLYHQYHRVMEGGAAESVEAFYPLLDSWLDVRVFPSEDGISVFFQNVSERKQAEQERERLAEREHRIATELQAAILPTIPERVPGLQLGYDYRAAWAEAGIGGDFAAVFSEDKGVSYLVVGDLSGKGLAAASQIGVVANMLRFAVHNWQNLADAVTSLNDTLADGGLLSGFATLFLGRYEAADQTLTYVNCGQDAGLIRRAASGEVVALPPTGPILGAISGAVFTKENIVLESGDVLALYTDGLTEAGPTRKALLTGDGVADLLRGLTGIADPQEIVSRLMAGVDAYAGSGVRDDQCLLVGVVAETGPP